MTLLDLIRVLLGNLKLMIIVPLVMAITVHRLTKGMPNKYSSETMIYTGVVSGFNLESNGSKSVDRTLVSSSFDNLMITISSNDTYRGVALRLLAQGLILEEPDSATIGPRGFKFLNENVSQEVRKEVVVPGNYEATLKKIEGATQYNALHPLNLIVNGKGPYYSIKALSTSSAKRVMGSDMIKISYSSDDPGICVNTLKLLLDVFITKYRKVKSSETADVVAFFEEKLRKTQAKLNNSEARMKVFREDAKILNYYEQTKALANKKEDMTDELSRVQGELAASKAIVSELEQKLGIDRQFLTTNSEILTLKDALAELSSVIALKEINGENQDEISRLKNQSRLLRESLKQDLISSYNHAHSVDGIPIVTLLENWLTNIIMIETNKAKEDAVSGRLQEIADKYDEFAPLGSGLKRLEREIGVNEREYIQMIHDLNMALLRQQNIEISSNITVMDAPNLQSLGNQRTLFVIIAFMMGFITITGGVIAIELLDVTLKTPERAVRFTKFELAGVFPLFSRKYKKVNRYIRNPLLNLTISKIQVNNSKNENLRRPVEIIVCSVQEQEGKTLLGSKIAKALHMADYKVLYLLPDRNEALFPNFQHYRVNKELLNIESVHNLIREGFDDTPYDYVIMELPALKKGIIPIQLLKNAHQILLALRSNRTWSNQDKYIMKNFVKEIDREPQLLLNGVKPMYLDTILGDFNKGKKKSFIRRIVKKMIKMEFKSSKFKKAVYD